MIAARATFEEHQVMSTTDPRDGGRHEKPSAPEAAAGAPGAPEQDVAPGAEPARKRRNPWIWISALLTLVAAGLLVWALAIRSDLDSTQQDVDQLQAQLDQGKETGSDVLAAGKAAYDGLVQQLGSTTEDLATAEQDLSNAKQDEAQAEQEADAAKEAAAKAENATDRANAEADQAKAEAQAAESKAAIASDCAKAYVSAIGTLFEGESVRAQTSAVLEQLSGITADCKDAFAGT
jgi:methyl-accepting chemotaxis protein